ncbi:MAG: lysophospholipid acyltransferase family protein [Nitrococcus sp.]|nr:lysophospholipid acyltransferase family protein [Nitrococcus sp.]
MALIIGLLRRLSPHLAMVVAGYVFAAVGVHTRWAKKVRANLAVAFADRSAMELNALLKSSFHNLGVALVELIHMPSIRRAPDRRIEFVLAAGANAPVAGKPTVFVTAHVGAWHMTPLIGPRYGVTLPIIQASEKNPHIGRQLARLRGAFGCPLVASKGGVRTLVQALNQGQCIGVTLDTRLDSGEPLPFFGESAWTNTIAARLALRYACDLVPVLAERLPGARYRVNVLPPIKPRDAKANAAAKARDMTIQVNHLFEGWIAARPGQWLCMKRRWPEATAARYLKRINAA